MASIDGEIELVMSVLGDTVDVNVARQALRVAENNPYLAVNMILDNPSRFSTSPALQVKQELVTVAKREADAVPLLMNVPFWAVKDENMDVSMAPSVKRELVDAAKKEKADVVPPQSNIPFMVVKEDDTELCGDSGKNRTIIVKKEDEKTMKQEPAAIHVVKEEKPCAGFGNDSTSKRFDDGYHSEEEFHRLIVATTHYSPYINPRPISGLKPVNADVRVQVVQVPEDVDDGDFPEEPDWFLVGRTNITGLSTCRGKRKLVCNEIVHLNFPSPNAIRKLARQWVSAKAAAATSEIVRFSTKRSGEIGRLPTEWSRCIIPLVNTSKVKVRARCVMAPLNLNLLQEIVLFASFYIHSSIFSDDDKSSLKLAAPSHLDSSIHPLPKLFTLLKMKAFKKPEFTPEELDTRKRSLNLHDDSEDSISMPALAKRRKGNQMYTEQSNDEQALSESALNKLVGAVEVYDLKEAEPHSTLQCDLRPYQKQALYWMSELEKGIDTEKAGKTLHPCWGAYHIADKRASAVYVNVFSGEARTQFPSALQMARGGILADAMGLGKTVMTIALLLHKPRRDTDDPDSLNGEMNEKNNKKQGRHSEIEVTPRVKGGTLIVCPMALLGQWKDELETHSKPGTITTFVHYGGDKTNDPRVISEPDVVITTYGVMGSAYKNDDSIFHRVDWYRVVLDEAHTIKSSKCRVSQAAFNLVSHCRWCLTGTPLQNNLEDLYSLLCFLHIEPWCNWAWWHKLIQKPYENGDERGLKLVKAILRPLMLRRTKETKDKEGRPILVLPPVHIEVLECEQTEAERDFYEALFRKSKVKFDQFVAQGKVLHNYASILELLLRLRQCCNHPFLVMSREDPDLSKLAQNFVGVTTEAYAEEVLHDIRRGGVTECPICLESASDDPVITACMHRMCRECLLSSWHSPSGGPCPICRKHLSKKDLFVCPGRSRFWVDVEENWKESSKISELMGCLEMLQVTGSGEKSIIFSQWTSFLDLLEIPLRRRGMEFLRFDGKLSQKQRERVLKEFSENTEKKILLMSLRAGGVGLNLTAASNVFLMDPWWNPAVEEQAIMRIHRIGQKRQVQVRRFIVKDTVEERMQQVQSRKQRMISGALTDEEVRTARIEELKMLFR